jgi:uncharacterized protein (DUF2384 family)
MQAYETQRATKAAMSIASSLGLIAHDAVVLHNSNKLTLRLRPCDVLARTLVLAMITMWRWDRDDQFPDGRRLGIEWLSEIRKATA